MAGMVTQHRDFMPGLEELTRFVNETKVEDYDGKELRRIVDAFGAILTKHLTEEVELLEKLVIHDGPALKKAYLEFDDKLRGGDKVNSFPGIFLLSWNADDMVVGAVSDCARERGWEVASGAGRREIPCSLL